MKHKIKSTGRIAVLGESFIVAQMHDEITIRVSRNYQLIKPGFEQNKPVIQDVPKRKVGV